MGTESEGFPDEPTFNLAALAGQEQLQERIRQLENERAGKVLVDPEDLRRGVAFARGVGYPPHGIVDVLDRLSDAAGSAPSGHPTSPESGHAVLPGITPRTAAGEAAECDSEPQAGDRP